MTKPPRIDAGTISDVMIGIVVIFIAMPANVSYEFSKGHKTMIHNQFLPIPITSRQINRLHQFCVKPWANIGNIQNSPVKKMTPRRPIKLFNGSENHALHMLAAGLTTDFGKSAVGILRHGRSLSWEYLRK